MPSNRSGSAPFELVCAELKLGVPLISHTLCPFFYWYLIKLIFGVFGNYLVEFYDILKSLNLDTLGELNVFRVDAWL